MARMSDEFASGTIKAEDLQGKDVTLTIRSSEMKMFEGDNGGKEKKIAIQFLKTDKELICNKTNRDIIVALHGDETDDWIGKKVTLYPTRVQFGPKMVWAIRIREPGGFPTTPQAQAAPATAYAQPAPPPQAGYAQAGYVPPAGFAHPDDDDIPF